MVNNGVQIKVSNTSYLSVTSFENKNSGTIENLGTIKVKGNWNNSSTDSVFSLDTGEVVLIGNSAQLIDGTTNFYKLEQNGSGGVTIQSGASTLSHTLYLTNGALAANGGLTLLSNATRTARIDEITGGSITGDITMQRYIDAGSTSWRFLTAATSGMTLAEFSGDFETTGYIGADYPNWPSAASPWQSIYFYDESVSGVIDNGYVAATNVTNTVVVGEGLWVWAGDTISGTEPFSTDMVGPANTGTINLPVSYTNTGNPNDDGWNMVGNPYPSSMDWNTGVTRVAVDDAIYIWNPDLGQFASYINGISTNGGTNKIASSQAFWVHATSALKSVQVTEASKTTNDTPFLKQAPSYLTIEALNAYGRDEAIVNFNANASLGFSGSYDAYKVASVETYRPSVSTLIDDSVELSINQMPDQGVSIPLKVTSATAGTHQINFLGLSNFTNASCLLLEDLFTGIIYDLTTTSSISVTISDTTTIARFLIRFGAETTTLISDASCYGLNDGSIVINKNSPHPFDIIWKDTQNNTLLTQTSVIGSDSINNLVSGTYLIETADAVCGNLSNSVVINEPLQILANYSTISDTIDLSQGEVAHFTNQSTNASYYDWDFGDINYSTQTNPTHQYTQAGIYNVEFIAYQTSSCFSTIYRDITVLDIITSFENSEENNNTKIWIKNNVLNVTSIVSFDKVEVRNVLGQELFSSTEAQNKLTFDLNSLSSQILIVRTLENGNIQSTKIQFIRR
tara:strand:- start:605 stop:2821 length:2217 start_codon:yes stop_codon:yes gene_type:complete